MQEMTLAVFVLPDNWTERLFIRKGDIQADFLATTLSIIHI